MEGGLLFQPEKWYLADASDMTNPSGVPMAGRDDYKLAMNMIHSTVKEVNVKGINKYFSDWLLRLASPDCARQYAAVCTLYMSCRFGVHPSKSRERAYNTLGPDHPVVMGILECFNRGGPYGRNLKRIARELAKLPDPTRKKFILDLVLFKHWGTILKGAAQYQEDRKKKEMKKEKEWRVIYYLLWQAGVPSFYSKGKTINLEKGADALKRQANRRGLYLDRPSPISLTARGVREKRPE